ncbi:MAG TPA: hypothetical protein VEH49_01990 [Methylomirabilota bacterium]|nr:hypothetical protein [Methylomirabilota bacterium]
MIFRKFLARTPWYGFCKSLGHYPDYGWWLLRGKPVRSPHLVKQRAVREYAARFGLRVLVETGTYYGEMIAATRRSFDRIYSIEFDPRLARLAQKRFAPFPHIRILQGDSQTLIPALLATLGEPALFWLDAGYYGWAGSQGDNTRLSAELEAILRHSLRNVVLLDDARGLDGRNGTLTVAQLTSYIESQFPGRSVAVLHDILRITPSSEANVRSPQPA